MISLGGNYVKPAEQETTERTTASLHLDIRSLAQQLERQYADFFVPAAEGIYVSDDINPVITPGRVYYTRGATGEYVRVTDLTHVQDAVYDQDGRVIISAYRMKNKEGHVSNRPILPGRGINIILGVIDHVLESIAPYVRISSAHLRVRRLILPEHQYLWDDGTLEMCCHPVISEVHRFIGDDVWHRYYVRLRFNDIYLEKTIDYRIHCWEQEHGHEYASRR